MTKGKQMNKRIKALAELAGYNGHYATEEFDIDEFARLIMQECISWSIDNKYIEQEYDAPIFTKELNQHFGVEA